MTTDDHRNMVNKYRWPQKYVRNPGQMLEKSDVHITNPGQMLEKCDRNPGQMLDECWK